jgi:acyl dehydratase
MAMTGLYLEDFEAGRVIEHAIRRTVTEMDNTLFSCLTHNPQPLHIDHEFSAQTEWGKPLVNSLFTLGLMIGISVSDTTLGTTIGNLGMTEVRFPKPVFHGDTLRVTTEVLSKRESRSRPDAGIVELLHKAINQKGEVVAECRRQAMMRRRPADATGA